MEEAHGFFLNRSEWVHLSAICSSDRGQIKTVAKKNPGKYVLVTRCDCGCYDKEKRELVWQAVRAESMAIFGQIHWQRAEHVQRILVLNQEGAEWPG